MSAAPPHREKEPDTREKCRHCGRIDCDEWACLVADIVCQTHEIDRVLDWHTHNESPACYAGEGPATSVDDPQSSQAGSGDRDPLCPPALDRDPPSVSHGGGRAGRRGD
jgi:hypothetical protein